MNHRQTRWLLIVAGTILWAILIYTSYYVIHKPLDPANLRALANLAGDLATWLALLAVAMALGSRLTRRLAYHSLLERLTFSTGLGLSLFSVVTLGLGLAGLLYRWLFWALLVVGGILLWPEFRELGRALRRVSWHRPKGAWQIFLSIFIASTLILALLLTLTPPTEWDSLTYHLVGPDRYAQAHRLTYEFDIYYLFFPSFTEMLFTAGVVLKGDIVPRLLHFSYLVLTVGALGAFAARHWERRQGLTAAALFLSIPTALQIATWSYVDLALTFYYFAAVYAVFNWLETQSHTHKQGPTVQTSGGWLVLAGLFAGSSSSIKYTGAMSVLAVGAILLWALVRRRLRPKRFLLGAVTVTGMALAVASPWYVKNAIVTGNPIYPLIWGGHGWNEVSTRWLLVLGEEKSLLDLLLVPWTLVVMGRQGTAAYDATFSPVFLLLLPLLLLVRREGKGIGVLLVSAAVGYVTWLVGGAASYGTFILRGRIVLPIFAPLSLLCAYALSSMHIWDRRSFSLQRVLTMIVGLTLAFGLLSQTLLVAGFNPIRYLTGFQSRDQFQDQYISQRWHPAITYLNENLDYDNKVLFIWEPRSYGTRVPHQPDVLLDNFSQFVSRYGSAENVAEGMRREGFTHVLVNQFIYPWIIADYPLTLEERAIWEEFEARYLTEGTAIYTDGEYLMLYRLPPESEPSPETGSSPST